MGRLDEAGMTHSSEKDFGFISFLFRGLQREAFSLFSSPVFFVCFLPKRYFFPPVMECSCETWLVPHSDYFLFFCFFFLIVSALKMQNSTDKYYLGIIRKRFIILK